MDGNALEMSNDDMFTATAIKEKMDRGFEPPDFELGEKVRFKVLFYNFVKLYDINK